LKERAGFPSMELVVVGYKKLNEKVKTLESAISNTKLTLEPIISASEGSFAFNVNRGVERVRGDWFFLVNDDWTFYPDWAEFLVEEMQKLKEDQELGYVGGLITLPDGQPAPGYLINITWNNGLFATQSSEIGAKDVFAYPVLIRTACFRDVSGMDERFSGSQVADVDLIWRIYKNGWKYAFVNKNIIIHHIDSNAETVLIKNRTRGIDINYLTKKYKVPTGSAV